MKADPSSFQKSTDITLLTSLLWGLFFFKTLALHIYVVYNISERSGVLMDKLRIAVVGCGNVSKRHFEAAFENENSELIACCDIVPEKADKIAEKYNIKAYYSFDELINTADFDVLHICTPHYLHAPMAIDAMNKAKHVFCEKPLAIHYEDAVEMCKCAENNNVYLAACFQNRYNLSSQYLKELVKSEKLGRIVAVKGNVTWDRDVDYYSDDWHGTLDKEGGGVIINQCIHTIDLIQWLVGSDVVSVDGSISQKRLMGKVETEDTADALIKFSDGVEALFYGTLCYKTNSSVFLEILFEKGTAVMYDDLVITDANGNREVIALKKSTDSKNYWGTSHKIIIDDFYDCIRNKKEFLVNGNSGSVAVRIVDELYKSAREK